MIICGINVTHDAAVAVIDGGTLVFSAEIEKLDNNPRYSQLGEIDRVLTILRSERIDPADVDCFAINGWYPPEHDASARVTAASRGRRVTLPVAPYVVTGVGREQLHRHLFGGLDTAPLRSGYVSYAHATSHVLASYCTSPFAARGEPALVLAWDGLMSPCLYSVTGKGRELALIGPLFSLVGDTFVEFCKGLAPFSYTVDGLTEEEIERCHLEIPGKAMAFAALGNAEPAAFGTLDVLLRELTGSTLASTVGQQIAARLGEFFPGLSDADLIATFQGYLGTRLLGNLASALRRHPEWESPNLCLAGGCALNIKWNSQLRDSGLFAEIWIPPFPNDAGSAIGTACCEMTSQTGYSALEWDVYSGPPLETAALPDGWPARDCDERGLAALLHETGEPVVVIDGRAELGPRALGNRSILAPAVDPAMKDRLNQMKGRASYRPVAPICLQARASEVFDPGGRDPYMLFEHRVRPQWAARLPAIVHLDGSARVQTIDPSTAGTRVGLVLAEYERLTGLPVLCNTSANFSGRGFFSSPASAGQWGLAGFIWSAGVLYSRPGHDSAAGVTAG